MFSASKSGKVSTGTPDPQFNYVTALLHGDGTNGAQNNTFVDSSSNAFTITRNGTPTQGSFSPYGSLWGNYFNGSSDYLTFAPGSATVFGTNNFTIECWVYATTNPHTNGMFFIDGRNSSQTTGFYFYFGSGNGIVWGGPSVTISNSTTYSANTWYHIAYVRNGTTGTIYVNGVSAASGTDNNNYTTSLTTAYIACRYSIANYVQGYISNMRIVNGTAVYTSGFTPSTTPLTAITNTSLLTCQSNRFIDNSTNAFALTISGTPQVQRFNPFLPTSSQAYSTSVYGGSGYFDGNSSYLIAPSTTSSAFAFGTGDFSIEMWAYIPSTSAYGRIFTSSSNNSNMDFPSGGAAIYYDGTSYSSGTLVANAWNHICITRNSGTLRTFLNGVMQYNGSNSTNISANAQYAFAAATNGGNPTIEYLSSIRIVKGGIPSAYVTSSTTNGTNIFTPPTVPFTGSESLTSGSVSLLMNYTNAGIYDNAMMNDWITASSAQINTSVKKYGTGSLSFNGSTDYLTTKSNVVMQLGSGNFTVEFWMYATTLSPSYQRIVTTTNGAFGSTDFTIRTQSAQIQVFCGSTTNYGGVSLSTNTWIHIAVVRNGTGTNNITTYINGTSAFQFTSTDNITTPIQFVGGYYSSGSEYFTGYLDDVRITKGYARYTANFTPPTAALPNYGS